MQKDNVDKEGTNQHDGGVPIKGFGKERPESARITIPERTFDDIVAGKGDALREEVKHQREVIARKEKQYDRLQREKEKFLQEVGDCRVESGKLEEKVQHLKEWLKMQRIMHIVGGLAIGIGCSITAANIKDEVSIFESYGLLFIVVGVGMYIVPLFIKEK